MMYYVKYKYNPPVNLGEIISYSKHKTENRRNVITFVASPTNIVWIFNSEEECTKVYEDLKSYAIDLNHGKLNN